MSDFSDTKPFAQRGKEAVDNAANKTQGGVRATQQAANTALDKASTALDQLKRSGASMGDEVSDQVQKHVQQGRDMFNDALQTLRDEASDAADKAVAYTKDEPVKAMLIAAAGGALLMGLLTMMSRSRD